MLTVAVAGRYMCSVCTVRSFRRRTCRRTISYRSELLALCHADRGPAQRVYGVAFPEKELLKDYQFRMEEAKKRDHRNVGTQQHLFMFHLLSPGSAFFLPNGTIVFNKLIDVRASMTLDALRSLLLALNAEFVALKCCALCFSDTGNLESFVIANIDWNCCPTSFTTGKHLLKHMYFSVHRAALSLKLASYSCQQTSGLKVVSSHADCSLAL